MPKKLKKIKVKKPKKPRQPRRAGVPRKPPVTNISVNITGGSGQPSGNYYFPDAQQVQPLVNSIFTPSLVPRPRVLEEPVIQPVEAAIQPVEPAPQTIPPRPIRLPQTPEISGVRGRPVDLFATSNKSVAQLREMATALGIDTANKTGKLLKSEIDYIKRKGF